MTVADLAYIDATGYNYEDFPSFLAFVQQGYQGIYGADVDVDPDSMDGQWTALLAQALYDTAALGASIYFSFAPPTAQGAGLSRVVKINGIERDVPSNSTAIVTIIGVAGTVITNGFATDVLSQQWDLPATVTIPSGGSIDVTATADQVGAVFAAENTITTIGTPTNGWQTVNNAAAATPGAPVEQDGDLRARQIQSVANPSLTVLEGTYGAVANVTGVTQVATWENFTGSNDANSQVPHSILVVVAGGALDDVASAIQIHKTPGTNPWSGPTNSGHNQSVVVPDSHGVPVTIGFFQPPISVEIGVQVNLTPGSGWTTDFETTIAAQVAAVINALGIGCGNQFSGAVRVIPLYSAVYVPNYNPSMYVINGIQIQLNGGGWGTSNIDISYVQLPVCSPSPGTDVTFVLS